MSARAEAGRWAAAMAAAAAMVAAGWLLRKDPPPAAGPADDAGGEEHAPAVGATARDGPPVAGTVPSRAATTSSGHAPTPADPVAAADGGDAPRPGDAGKRLLELTTWSERHRLLLDVSRRHGNAGVARALGDGLALLPAGPHPDRGPLHGHRAVSRFRLGDREGAAADVAAAVALLDVEWVDDDAPYPLLFAFAAGPNAMPAGAPGRRTRALDAGDLDAPWGFPVYPEGADPFVARDEFPRWLLEVADDARDPERAMAASVWLHALAMRQPSGMTDGFPPAAHRLAERFPAPGTGIVERFPGSVAAASEAGDPAAARYRRCVARGDTLRERTRGRAPTWLTRFDIIVWSLHEEVVVRFEKADTPGARTLRGLAERLTRYGDLE